MKTLCKCGKIATWIYMPDEFDNAYCDDCVSRGCSCNVFNILEVEPYGEEGKDWRFLTEPMTAEFLDGNGRQLPCCEFWYSEEGFDND